MNQKQKYMIEEGILLLAYAYAISSYHTAAIIVGIIAVSCAVLSHSWNRLIINIRCILMYSVLQIVFIYMMKLDVQIPTLPILTLLNTIFSILWLESSYKATVQLIKIITTELLVFLLIALCMPQSAIAMICGRQDMTMMQLCILILLIYVPQLYFFFLREIRRHDYHFVVSRIIILNKIFKENQYDGMVSKSIH